MSFKATLFTIPSEVTQELLDWCGANSSWIQLGVHGFKHTSNYECDKMSYEEFDANMRSFEPMFDKYFVKGFKAPGWMISDGIYRWLSEHDYWVADQSYNDRRRPPIKAYINDNGVFRVGELVVNGKHYHTWNCVGNGVYEMQEQIITDVKATTEFKFISELFA